MTRHLQVAQFHVHVDVGALLRAGGNKRRMRLDRFEVVQDRGGFVKDEPVMIERGHAAVRIDGEIGGIAMLAGRHVDDDRLRGNLLFHAGNENPPRIGGQWMVVELERHVGAPQIGSFSRALAAPETAVRDGRAGHCASRT